MQINNKVSKSEEVSEVKGASDEHKSFRTNRNFGQNRLLIRKSLIEQVAVINGIADIQTVSDKLKFRVYRLTLIEVELILRAEDIAKASLLAMKTALNEIENGFLSLLKGYNRVNQTVIHAALPKLIDAKAYLTAAIIKYQQKDMSFEYIQSLSKCKRLIVEINQLLS